MKKVNRLFGIFLTLGTFAGTQIFQFPQLAQAQTSFGNLCAAPGKDGVDDGTVSIVNTYYSGPTSNTTVSSGATSIPVGPKNTQGNQTDISPGDLLLVIQMQDADINFSDTNAYGSGVATNNGSGSTNINQTGLYEYVVATSGVVNGAISIRGANGGGLINSYRQRSADITANGQRTYQVVRVPQYTKTTLTATSVIRSPGAWNGTSGGIVVMDVANTFTLNGQIDVQDKGFRGGGGTTNTNTYPPQEDEAYRTDGNVARGGVKGEGIAGTPKYVFDGTSTTTNTIDGYPRLKSQDSYTTSGGNVDGGSRARGAPGNAGGGGNMHNSGGGGGGNGGTGGKGGDSIQPKGLTVTNTTGRNKPVGGRGGSSFPASVTRLIMGGGGGAGDANNGVAGSGGLGGGIVMLRAGSIAGSGKISARARDGVDTPTDDGGSGAGAGGSILIDAKSGSLANITLNANGGNGGNTHTVAVNTFDFGPGGGGGGGVIISALPLGTATVDGGNYGQTFNGTLGGTTGVPRGAAVGTNGTKTSGVLSSAIPGISSGANCSINLSGKVWNDKDNSIIQEAGENGTNAGELYVYMVDGSSKVVAKSTVGSDGSYSMVVPNNVSYTLLLSTDGTKVFADTAPAASLPSDWVNTGENKNGTTETITPGVIAVTTTTSDVINQSFAITNSAKVILVKRITAIKSGTTTTTYSTFKNNPDTLNDTHPNWPIGFIDGEYSPGIIKPGDEIEYTIYFMNAQGSTASNVRICDRIIGSQSFIQNAYGANKDIQYKLGAGTVKDFTQLADGNDRAQFYAAGATPSPTGCNWQSLPVGKKDNGTVAIDITGVVKTNQPALSAISGAAGVDKANSYGFFRFKTKVTP